jgi:hypothetical protein
MSRGIFEHHLAGAGKRSCGLIQIFQCAQACFFVGLDGIAEQVTQQSFQNFQRVVLCSGFETIHEGYQCGQAALIRQAKYSADLGSPCEPRQSCHSDCWYPRY